MATISNAKLTISHDHTKKTARPVVKAQIGFTQCEMNQMKDGLKFKLKCQLWGADPGLFDGDDDFLFTYSPVKFYPDASPAVTEDALFDVTLGEGVLDEDWGTDTIYAKLILTNQYTLVKVKKNTNQVSHSF
jgi:hypothetical protein